jgi:predicted DCC family thiol-disulfide oxidoreductase YuxK
MIPQPQTIVLFDGVCNFCNQWVVFILKRNKTIHFASLQSPFGQSITKNLDSKLQNLDTMILIHHSKIYTQSDASIRTLAAIGIWYKIIYVFLIIPKPIRDFGYMLIAKNRYKWWGKKSSCMIPTPDIASRFI